MSDEKKGPNKKGKGRKKNNKSGSSQPTSSPQQQPSSSQLQCEVQQVEQPSAADEWQTFSGKKDKKPAATPSAVQQQAQAGPSAQRSAWGAGGIHEKLSKPKVASSQGQPGAGGFPKSFGSQQSLPSAWQKDTVVPPLFQVTQQSNQAVKKPTLPVPVSKMSKMEISTPSISPARGQNIQQKGTLGRRIKVQTNMMQILFGKNFPDKVYFYDVDIKPDKKKYLCRKIFEEGLRALFPQQRSIVAFDSKKIAISAKKLKFTNQNSVTVIVKDDDGKDNEYTVTLQLAKELDFTWFKKIQYGLLMDDQKSTSLQALNIIFNHAAIKCSLPLKRSFYMNPKDFNMKPVDIGSGMDLNVGLFQSVVIGSKPFLNVDVVHKGFFREQNLLELIKIICIENTRFQRGQNVRPQNQRLTMEMILNNWDLINTTIKGLRITIIENGRKIRSRQRIESLVRKVPAEDIFHFDKINANISVQQYYLKEKNYRIAFPDLPCVMLGNKHKSHIPIETCMIEPGQSTEKPEVVDKTKRNIVKEATVDTIRRKQKIMDVVKPVNHNADDYMREFGVSISNEFATIDARILNPPNLYYKDNKASQVNKGVWEVLGFMNPQTDISADGSWTVVIIDRRLHIDAAYNFAEIFRRDAQNKGMPVGQPNRSEYEILRSNLVDIERKFKKLKGLGIKFVVVIFDGEKETYAKFKQIAELKVGILTQGIKSFTYNKKICEGDRATITNILQKDNAKLNGINHSFTPRLSTLPFLKKCMIMGADVTHKPPGSDFPSVAAVTASHDPETHFQYNAVIKLQEKETILHFEATMKIHLERFHKKNGYWPEKLIFYRDGVGNSQIQEIVDVEVSAIKKAYQSMTKIEPKITFLIVQKRHHVRLFPTRREDSDDRCFNAKAGTIVDSEITNTDPKYKEFYLLSHGSIQGTSRPTKYMVLYTNDSLTIDELQSLTYYLCHNFARCARSVSYPAPTYYAHLAAYRAKALIYKVPIKLADLEAEQIRKLTLHKDIDNFPMFFI